MKKILLLTLSCITITFASAQIADSCKLQFGTNLGGLSDYGTEQPFVNLMRSARVWYTKDVGNPSSPWNSGNPDLLTYLSNGYPTHCPQIISGITYPQIAATVWGDTGGWEDGSYTVLFDGTGQLDFWNVSNIQHPTANSYTFDFSFSSNQVVEMKISISDINDPIQNIRIVKNDYLSTYETQPYNPHWLEKVIMFKSVRFMDWGHTNNWGQPDSYDWDFQNDSQFDWEDRAKFDYYTWTTHKGIPYEMFIDLMNKYDVDGWVCVPHNASNDYITQMANFFHSQLNSSRHLTVEYSNEIWNWMFGQAQWLNQYGCINQNVTWPEGTVPYIQNCMDIWTSIWGADASRLTRAVGVQTGWLDVAQRTAFNMTPGSFDAVAGTYYFGFGQTGHNTLDLLGASATVSDISLAVRNYWSQEKDRMSDIKTQLTDVLNLPFIFYEGGQHLTPSPFGTMPSYAQALLDIQRDTSMYNLYNEWFDFMRTLQDGNEPLLCMNFSLISNRSAQYGSWGIWETMFQDTTIIPAPKLKAIAENMYACWEDETLQIQESNKVETLILYPNPTEDYIIIESPRETSISIYSILGELKLSTSLSSGKNKIDLSPFSAGVYIITSSFGERMKVIKK
ncbi:MAG: T9SS type A sorting domain-containing protein [Brumimicrobium sp.]|nr:T9SS type A sorting domain-containing protein [Brumimicrobium sp.]